MLRTRIRATAFVGTSTSPLPHSRVSKPSNSFKMRESQNLHHSNLSTSSSKLNMDEKSTTSSENLDSKTYQKHVYAALPNMGCRIHTRPASNPLPLAGHRLETSFLPSKNEHSVILRDCSCSLSATLMVEKVKPILLPLESSPCLAADEFVIMGSIAAYTDRWPLRPIVVSSFKNTETLLGQSGSLYGYQLQQLLL